MKVALIFVLFEPQNNNWRKSVDVAYGKGFLPIVVDNSINFLPLPEDNIQKYIYYRCNENVGIGKAQNIGIKKAFDNKADVVGFFDQDSVLTEELLNALEKELENEEIKIVAPISYDVVTGREYPSHRVGRSGKLVDVFGDSQRENIPVDIAISSGTFAKKCVFQEVGYFNERLFIDFVDIEWCLRCRKKGIQIFIVPNAKMCHSIGEKNKRIGPINIEVHSPYRLYYKVRNSFLLLKYKVKMKIAIYQILPAIILNFFLLFDKKNGKKYRHYYIRGIFDGIKQVDGKYEDIYK